MTTTTAPDTGTVRAAIWIVVVWAALFLPRFMSLPDASLPGASSSLAFESTEFRFGRCFEGARLTHRFRFRNTGDRPVRVTGVSRTCGCVFGSAERRPIAPGESSFVDVTIDTRNRVGRQDRAVLIETDQPGVLPFPLWVRGDVDVAAVVKPRAVQHVVAFPATGHRERVHVSFVEDVDPAAVDVVVEGDGVHATFEPAGADAGVLDVHVTSAETRGVRGADVTLRFTAPGHDEPVDVVVPVHVLFAERDRETAHSSGWSR